MANGLSLLVRCIRFISLSLVFCVPRSFIFFLFLHLSIVSFTLYITFSWFLLSLFRLYYISLPFLSYLSRLFSSAYLTIPFCFLYFSLSISLSLSPFFLRSFTFLLYHSLLSLTLFFSSLSSFCFYVISPSLFDIYSVNSSLIFPLTLPFPFSFFFLS